MARVPFRLQMKIVEVACIDEADGPGDAEPYIWPVFFKIDGQSFAVGFPTVGLIGFPTVISTQGIHGNLNNEDVDAGDVVPVPAAVGTTETIFFPIPVLDPDSRNQVGEDLPGIAGIVLVLMEEDNWQDAFPKAGYTAFVEAVQLGVARAAASFQHALTPPSDADIATQIGQVKQLAEKMVRGAILNQMSGGDLVWYGTGGNNDDQIISHAWIIDQDDFKATNVITKYEHWRNDKTNGNGHWGIKVRFTNLDGAPPPLDLARCADLAAQIAFVREEIRNTTDIAERKRLNVRLGQLRDQSRRLGCPSS